MSDFMGKAHGRIGGRVSGHSLDCTIHNTSTRGRLGGAVAGNDVRLELSPEGTRLWAGLVGVL